MTSAALDVARATPWFRVPRATNRLGELLAHASNALAGGVHEDALGALAMALTLAPADIGLRLRYAVLLAHQGRHRAAQDAFMDVLDRDRTNLDALISLAELCRGAKHLVGAVDLLEHARRFHGDHPDVLAALAGIALDLADVDGAMRLLVHLQRRTPTHPDLDTLVQRVADQRARENLAALGL